EPAVFAGELVAAVFVAGVEAQGEAVFDAQDDVGLAVGPPGGVDEVDGAEGVVVEPGEVGPQEGGVDGLTGGEADLSGEAFGFEVLGAFGAHFAEAGFDDGELDDAGGDVLFEDEDVDDGAVFAAVVEDDLAHDGVEVAHAQGRADARGEPGGPFGLVQQGDALDADAGDFGASGDADVSGAG